MLQLLSPSVACPFATAGYCMQLLLGGACAASLDR